MPASTCIDVSTEGMGGRHGRQERSVPDVVGVRQVGGQRPAAVHVDRVERAQAASSAIQGPANILMQAPPQLASAPQQLSSMLSQFAGGSAATWLNKARRFPSGSPAVARSRVSTAEPRKVQPYFPAVAN